VTVDDGAAETDAALDLATIGSDVIGVEDA
jgi:hypothetical protein